MPETLHIIGAASGSLAALCALMLAGVPLPRVALAVFAAGIGALTLGNLMNDYVGLHSGYVTGQSPFSWTGARFGALLGFSSVLVLSWLPPKAQNA